MASARRSGTGPRNRPIAALAHVLQNRVEADDAHSDLFERRRVLMNDWAEYRGEKHGQVVTLRR